jgi:hypothetical protein
MVRFLLLLTLLLTPLRSDYVLAQTTCSTVLVCPGNSLSSCKYETTCTTVDTCQSETEVRTQSCPINQSGSITETRTKSCPSETWSDWQVSSNTCTQNPPTCQVTTETQTLSCPTGYTGSITQMRSSTCPDPYGSPTWQPWVTTSDTCKKSINNPTNPVSPVSPLNPASATSAPTIQSSPVTVQTPNTVPNSETTPTASTETQTTETTTDSQTTSTTPASQSPPPKGKVRSVVGLVLSLELFVKPGLVQANVFPEVSIVQGIPNNILTQDLIMMDLLQQPSYNQPFDAPDLGFEQ